MHIFIFRRDLRKQDNVGLNTLLKAWTQDDPILPIFIFDPVQINSSKNKYFSHNAVQFMHESLKELSSSLYSMLHCFHGPVVDVLDMLFRELPNIKDVTVNEDYTPFSRKRDASIAKLCKRFGKQFHTHEDIPLGDFKSVKTGAGQPYKKFKYFHQKIVQQPLRHPEIVAVKKCMLVPQSVTQTFKMKVALKWLEQQYTSNPHILVRGGRKAAIARLKRAVSLLPNYQRDRMHPLVQSQHPTTLLSACLKFGVVSVREACAFLLTRGRINIRHPLIRQIVWKDFYYNLTFYYPHSFRHTAAPNTWKRFKWCKSQAKFKKWCTGTTGYPFVDAGMRQLVKTGYMPNRLRLCCSSFLIKNLRLDWRWGEKFFAQHLTDYDPAINNGNWQWVSSTGYESQPYYRYINPITDISKFDAQCEYIKRYIPELASVDASIIRAWHTREAPLSTVNYPLAMVDFKESMAEYQTLAKSIH